MRKRLACIYVAIKNNEALFYETNLTDFIKKLNALGLEVENYSHYSRKFKKQKTVHHISKDNETYFFQKIT